MVTPLRGLSVDQNPMNLTIFWKSIKFAIHWYTAWLYLKNSIFCNLAWWAWQNGAISPPRGRSIDFKYIVLIFFLIYIKFAVYWYVIWPYWAILIFFSLWGNMGGAYGGVPSPIEADQEKIWLGSLDFRNLHAFKCPWSKFHAFITICTIFVLVAWTSNA